jgi:hypothetical protein
MDLHGIVSGAIGAVNPFITATVQKSAGYTTSADGTQVPAYTSSTAQIQVQALSARDIQHLDQMNITGVMRKIYLEGDWQSLVRPAGKGGDLILFNNQTWLVTQVMETWPDWSLVAVTLQMG